MPASIVPINLTRDFSVRPVKGLRYGNFEGVVYLPPTTKDDKVAEIDFSRLNNQQIYKKIGDWFEAWRPWQQQHLLCGIVDRYKGNLLFFCFFFCHGSKIKIFLHEI